RAGGGRGGAADPADQGRERARPASGERGGERPARLIGGGCGGARGIKPTDAVGTMEKEKEGKCGKKMRKEKENEKSEKTC
ncbi:unnamed protein product, partial [Urochloa humidicola]